MKISKIYISAFGGLKDFTLCLDDGFNVIYGKNENGKTTVMAFIKCMFYGTGAKKHTSALSLREKYTPWDGSQMGGRIFFTQNGTEYILERIFRKSDSTDKITLTNVNTGETTAVSGSIGDRFFGLSEKAFLRTVFIDNETVFPEDTAAESDLSARLSNAAITEDDVTSAEKIIARIKKGRNEVLSVSGRAGTLAADRTLLLDLQNKCEKCEILAKRRSEISEEAERLQKESLTLKAEYEKYRRIADSENDVRNADKIKNYIELSGKLDILDASLSLKNGSAVGKIFYDTATLGLNNCEKHEKNIELLKSELESAKTALKNAALHSPEELCKTRCELENKKADLLKNQADASKKLDGLKAKQTALESINSKNNLPIFIVLLLVFVSLLAVSAYMFFGAKTVVPAVLFAAAGLAGTAATIISAVISRNRTKKNADELTFINSDISAAENELAAFTEALSDTELKLKENSAAEAAQKALREQTNLTFEDYAQKIAAEEGKLKRAVAELIEYLSKYRPVADTESARELLSEIKSVLERKKTLKERLGYLAADLGLSSVKNAEERLAALGTDAGTDAAAVETAKEKVTELNQKILNIHQRLTECITELKTGFADFVSPETVKRSINAVKQTVSAKEDFCRAADIAAEELKNSADDMRKNYGGKLADDVKQIFAGLTGERYNDIRLGSGLAVSVQQSDSFGMHESAYLSKGTAGQAYLSLRLAISRMLSEKESLPLFLDDSLCQYDDERQKLALAFLKEYSKNAQTVLFSCHGYLCDEAEKLGVTVNKNFI